MTSSSFVTRFAPSPTGFLHLGHAYSALCAYGAARAAGGRFLLRIEDTDVSRCRPEFEAAILEDLAWLGLSWEQPVRRQSEHMADYAKALAQLREAGLLYPCFCTRRAIREEIARSPSAPHGPDGPLYPGTCRRLAEKERQARIAAGEGYAERLDLASACTWLRARGIEPLTWVEEGEGAIVAQPEQLGDAVLARKEFKTSYHLSVVVDDALQGISHVIRGRDLRHATHLHRLLQALLDLPTPRYRHHGLIADETGKRLAKRDGAMTLRGQRESGRKLESLLRQLNAMPAAPESESENG